eukprot:GHRQ01038767.1.p5 GENE.GHRQ01038767.1~~GHRQ01038767.1.p5  ORF type:complete len:122 (+),score=35.97 GHRQ01038767.1:178-543(+)
MHWWRAYLSTGVPSCCWFTCLATTLLAVCFSCWRPARRHLPLPHQLSAAKAAAPYSVSMTKGAMGMPAAADTVLPGSGLSAVGEVLLVPDLSAVQALPWAVGHSIAPADMLEKDLSECCCL